MAALLALLPASATARVEPHGAARAGMALQRPGARSLAASSTEVGSCPAGVPMQTITIVNQANVRAVALAKVENAIVAQSLQLRAAWGTPCVTFGSGGWLLFLKGGYGPDLGLHSFSGSPYAIVWTSGGTYVAWSQPFSHEVAEMLVDPTAAVDYTVDGVSSQLEIADPVEDHAYRLDGVWVTDFVLPSYFAGATLGACAVDRSDEWCIPTAVGDTDTSMAAPVIGGPLIAPADATGPYDEMRLLVAPWQADSDDD